MKEKHINFRIKEIKRTNKTHASFLHQLTLGIRKFQI